MAYDTDTFGQRLRRVRKRRDKTLVVVAGLAGVSKSQLHRFETGESSPSLPEIFALADALQVSASELTRLPIPAPANGHTDSTIEALRVVLDAVEDDRPEGLVLPVSGLRHQVAEVHRQRRACEFAEVATVLPGLIRNLHTTLAAGQSHAELLDLAVRLHVHVTRLWLMHASAPTDLVRRVVFLAQRLAQRRDEASTLGVAAFGVADMLLAGGAISQARAKFDGMTLPPTTERTAGLAGHVTASYARIAALDGRRAEAASAMDAAIELAGRFPVAEIDALGFAYGPFHAGIGRIWVALEAGEPDKAVTAARHVHPERHPYAVNRAHYWMHCGRALAQLPKRREDAVMALRRAERIFPTKVLRDPMVRNALSELLTRAPGGAAGQELRGMAYRAGLNA